MRCLVILRQAVILGRLIVSRVMRRRHVTLRRGGRADSQVALVATCAGEFASAAQAAALKMFGYVVIAVVRYNFFIFANYIF